MAEYIDRTQAIDAIEVHMYRQDPDDRGVYPLEDWQREQNYAYDLAMEILGNLPAADVVEVVRCRDCKHYNAGFECLIEGYGIEHPADYFCADGKRKDGGQAQRRGLRDRGTKP